VFQRTWARLGVPTPLQEFWQETVQTVRARFPQFCFIAEVYWGLEARLQALGFALTYDKEWYDALIVRDTDRLRAGLQHPRTTLEQQLRFLENHDEPRAASRYSEAQEEAAAVATLTLPGTVLLYDGQLEGRRIREPVQLRRRQPEPINQQLQAFYERLLALPDIRQGVLQPLQPSSAWEGNWTWQAFLAWGWSQSTTCWLVVINYADVTGQCYVNLAALPLPAEALHFKDLLHPDIVYERRRSDVQQQGMYFEMPPFGTHLFTIQAGPEQ
jgi:glycosidase